MGRMIRFVFYWKRTGWTPNLGLAMRIAGPDGRDIATQTHMIGYRVYPASAWPEGVVLAERYSLYVPPEVRGGEYGIKLSVFSLMSTSIIPFRSPDAQKPFNVIEVRRIQIPDLPEGTAR